MLDFRIFILLLFLTLIIGCGAGSESTTAIISNGSETYIESSQDELLASINKVRNQKVDCNNGLGYVGPSQPLSWNSELYDAAYEHSYDLAMTDTFSHSGSGTEYDIAGYDRGKKSEFTERISDHGYSNYKSVGENIAVGFSNVDEVIEGLLKSPTHCENLMRDDFDEVGVAIVVNPNSTYGTYWTQNFGHQDKINEK